MRRKTKRIIGIVMVLITATLCLVYGPKVKRFLDIDSCLDRGGSWHYDVNECSFTENYRGLR